MTSRIEYEWANYEATADSAPLKVVARDTTMLTVDRRIDLQYHYVHPLIIPNLGRDDWLLAGAQSSLLEGSRLAAPAGRGAAADDIGTAWGPRR